jgi:hypothetical protein
MGSRRVSESDHHDHPHGHAHPRPPSDGSGEGLGGKNVPGASLSHEGHQASEDNPASDGSGTGLGGKNVEGMSTDTVPSSPAARVPTPRTPAPDKHALSHDNADDPNYPAGLNSGAPTVDDPRHGNYGKLCTCGAMNVKHVHQAGGPVAID